MQILLVAGFEFFGIPKAPALKILSVSSYWPEPYHSIDEVESTRDGGREISWHQKLPQPSRLRLLPDSHYATCIWVIWFQYSHIVPKKKKKKKKMNLTLRGIDNSLQLSIRVLLNVYVKEFYMPINMINALKGLIPPLPFNWIMQHMYIEPLLRSSLIGIDYN